MIAKELATALLLGCSLSFLYSLLGLPVGVFSGRFPPLYFGLKVKKRKAPGKRRRIILRFLFDLLFSLFAGLILTVFDCAVLGGKLRFYHFAAILLGYTAAYFLYQSVLRRPLCFLSQVLVDVIRLLLRLLCMPFCIAGKFLGRIISRLLLIIGAFYGKIKIRLIGGIQERRILISAGSAFLDKEGLRAVTSFPVVKPGK